MRRLVGAYAASPSHSAWRPEDEARFYAGLRELPIGGLEHPFYGALHRWDDAFFLREIDPRWDFVFTCLPGTMDNLARDPAFGLASDDEGGRRAALALVDAAFAAASKLNGTLGRQAVKAIVVHSAPRSREGRASRAALARSFAELAGRDRQGTELLLEHCDAPVDGRVPDKGFLALEDELAATEGRAGIVLNWGRSALEARSPEGPVEHLSLAKGRVRGLMFSGVTPEHPLYGSWRDSHAPFSSEEPASLMTREAARAWLEAARSEDLAFVGIKVQALPRELGVEARLELVRKSLEALDQC